MAYSGCTAVFKSSKDDLIGHDKNTLIPFPPSEIKQDKSGFERTASPNRLYRVYSGKPADIRRKSHFQPPVPSDRKNGIPCDALIYWCEFGVCLAITAFAIASH